MTLTVSEFMKLPYNYMIKPVSDESGTYFHGIVLELDGCQSTGMTIDETYQDLREAMEGYLETKIANGITIPKPLEVENFSGKFVLRIPKSLHCRLAIEAEKEGVSLNQYALYKLSL